MSNKSQLQSNNTSLDILTDRVNAAKQIVAELPDAPTAEQFYDHVTNQDIHVTAAEKTSWDNKADTDVATTSAKGLMSSADKTKLDGIAANATAITVDSNLSASSSNPVRNSAVTSALNGKLGTGDTAAAAKKWETPRTVLVDLESASSDSIDGTENITPGVSGTLPVNRGGTGRSTLTSGYFLKGNGTSAVSLQTAQAARNAMGLGNTTGALPIANGGTGAATANAAANNLCEIGTWTPTLGWTSYTDAPNVTYTRQYGSYVRNGRIVTASFQLWFTTASGWTTYNDYIRICGLPYNANSTYFGSLGFQMLGNHAQNQKLGISNVNNTSQLNVLQTNGDSVKLSSTIIGNFYITGAITYCISE